MRDFEAERNEMAEIIAKNFNTCGGDTYDSSDFEWAAHCLQEAGFHRKCEKKTHFSPEDVRSMTQREVRKNYKKIRKSMKKWK